MFQTKDFLSIVAAMINYMRGATTKITDYNVGSIARTLIEAPAIEMDQLYQQMVNGLVEAIPVATYNTFNFPALTAQPASGPIRVTITSSSAATLIPAGSIFNRPDALVTYASISDITISAGSTYGDVPVTATSTGSITNTDAGTTFTVSPAITGFVSASNLTAFTTGTDAETAPARQVRFQQYISTLQRGTIAAVLYGAQNAKLYDANGNITEQVQFAQLTEAYILDNTQPVALLNIWVHNGVGSTSAALVAQAIKVIQGYVDSNGNNVPGYKAAGTKIVLAAAAEILVNVTGTLTAAAGYDHATLVGLAQQAIYSYILGLPLLQPPVTYTGTTPSYSSTEGLVPNSVCQLATLYETVMSIPGVANFVLTSPATDTTSVAGQKLMPGTITID